MSAIAQKLALIAACVAFVEARFGQENVPAPAIAALGQFGNPGQAATFSGQVPSVLLAAASPCDKLSLADEIVAALGDDPAVIDAAIGLVAAEMNFNPFAVDVPNICGDASLPATAALRGIVPIVDPAVVGADLANQLSAQSIQNPFDATGLSVSDIFIANGFTNFQTDGVLNSGAGETGGAVGGGAGNDTAEEVDNGAGQDDNAQENNGDACANDGAQDDVAEEEEEVDNGGNAGGNAGAGGADFGLCDPTMDFVLGRNGRDADEGTFNAVDPLIGGSEALNINIITERICNGVADQCDGNEAAIALCAEAEAEVAAAAPGGPELADLFNGILGF